MRVLLVEDNEDDMVLVREMLAAAEGQAIELQWADSLSAAMRQVDGDDADAILLDLSLPDSRGLATFERMYRAASDSAIIVLSGLEDSELSVEAVRQGAQDYLVKGRFDHNLLNRSLRYAVERKRIEKKFQLQQQRLAALNQINAAITSTLDTATILARLREKIDLLVHESAGSLWLVDSRNGQINRSMCWNVDEKEFAAWNFDETPPIIQIVLTTKEACIVRRLQTDPRVQNTGYFQNQRLVSCIALPLSADGKILGALSVFSRSECDFEKEDQQVLMALAERTAMAINNAQLHETIKTQTEKLEAANRFRADFDAMIAHDLRSPLTHIIGLADMMREDLLGSLNTDQKNTLAKIAVTGRNLVQHVAEFLDFSILDAGHIRLNIQTFHPGEFIAEVIDNHRLAAQRKDIRLNADIDPGLPAIDADRRRLEQVLNNLMDNAVKFTGKGGEIGVVASQDRDRALKIVVEDTGAGISGEELPQVFQKYQQASSADACKEHGTGLGLAICKMIVEAHKGKIWAESEEHTGSTFFISLPFSA